MSCSRVNGHLVCDIGNSRRGKSYQRVSTRPISVTQTVSAVVFRLGCILASQWKCLVQRHAH